MGRLRRTYLNVSDKPSINGEINEKIQKNWPRNITEGGGTGKDGQCEAIQVLQEVTEIK